MPAFHWSCTNVHLSPSRRIGRQHEETLNAVKDAASEHVPFKIEAYLDEFSKTLAKEVSALLAEVGKLREERRNIQYEIGCLLCKNSKYGPDGEFDPSWYVCTDLPSGTRELTGASGPLQADRVPMDHRCLEQHRM
jgi:hypothetical protein